MAKKRTTHTPAKPRAVRAKSAAAKTTSTTAERTPTPSNFQSRIREVLEKIRRGEVSVTRHDRVYVGDPDLYGWVGAGKRPATAKPGTGRDGGGSSSGAAGTSGTTTKGDKR